MKAFTVGVLSLLLVFILEPSTPPAPGSYAIVWNVGQGQWVTFSENNRCLHFDMGGESFNRNLVRKHCTGKVNYIYISHTDRDHIRFLKSFSYLSSQLNFCSKQWKQTIYQKMRLDLSQDAGCPQATLFIPKLAKTTNDSSHVFYYNYWLFPGDGSTQYEKLWLNSVKQTENAKFILAGHHGSKFSNSKQLLKSLPKLQQFIVSARRSKYGHPHSEVINRLGKRRQIVLKTEDWGNLFFEF